MTILLLQIKQFLIAHDEGFIRMASAEWLQWPFSVRYPSWTIILHMVRIDTCFNSAARCTVSQINLRFWSIISNPMPYCPWTVTRTVPNFVTVRCFLPGLCHFWPGCPLSLVCRRLTAFAPVWFGLCHFAWHSRWHSPVSQSDLFTGLLLIAFHVSLP